MSERSEKSPSDSQVEVVADQTEDGSYEIRVERPGRRGASTPTPTIAIRADAAPRSRRTPLWIGLGALGAAAVGAIALAVGGESEPPPLPDPEPSTTFRAYTIEVPTVPRIRAPILNSDVGIVRPGLDAGTAAVVATGDGSGQGEPAADELEAQALDDSEFDERTAARLARVPVAASSTPLGDEPEGREEAEDEYDDEDFAEDDEYEGFADDDEFE